MDFVELLLCIAGNLFLPGLGAMLAFFIVLEGGRAAWRALR